MFSQRFKESMKKASSDNLFITANSTFAGVYGSPYTTVGTPPQQVANPYTIGNDTFYNSVSFDLQASVSTMQTTYGSELIPNCGFAHINSTTFKSLSDQSYYS